MEQLDQEGAARLEVPVGEVHGQLRQVHRPRLVDRVHTTLIGGHVGQHKVHGRAVQQGFKLR